MHGMTPLEVKYHLQDVERSFVACRASSQSVTERAFPGRSWLGAFAHWVNRPATMILKRLMTSGATNRSPVKPG
jgi:hypothetical protein